MKDISQEKTIKKVQEQGKDWFVCSSDEEGRAELNTLSHSKRIGNERQPRM